MTAFSLRLTNGANAVSQLHAETANAHLAGHRRRTRSWAITNGVHGPTWVGAPVVELFARHLDADLDDARRGQRRRTASGSASTASRPTTCGRRTSARSASSRSSSAAGCAASSPATARRRRSWPSSTTALDPGDLDDRLRPAVRDLQAGRPAVHATWTAWRACCGTRTGPSRSSSPARPIPADRPGQRVIQEIFQRSRSAELRGRVFILEDYDMRVGRFLVQGVDVWLNNPRRPLEASGTSGMKAAAERRAEHERARRLVGRGLHRRQRLGHRRPRDDHRRGGPGLGRRPGPLPASSRTSSMPALLRARRGGRAARAGSSVMRRSMATHALAVLDDADAPGIHRAAVPARGRRRGPAAGGPPARRSRRPADGRGAADLAGARAPQPPAGRELRLGLRRGLRAGLRADDRGARAPSRRPPVAPLHRPAAGVAGRRAAGRHRATCARWSSAGRSRSWAAGFYEPVLASLPERDRVGQLARMADELERRSGGGRAARGWRSASGSRTCRPRSSRRATSGRSSTTRISAPPRSPRRTCGARTRPRTRAACCASSAPSRACATGSRSATSTRSSTTCASTPPRPATGSG